MRTRSGTAKASADHKTGASVKKKQIRIQPARGWQTKATIENESNHTTIRSAESDSRLRGAALRGEQLHEEMPPTADDCQRPPTQVPNVRVALFPLRSPTLPSSRMSPRVSAVADATAHPPRP